MPGICSHLGCFCRSQTHLSLALGPCGPCSVVNVLFGVDLSSTIGILQMKESAAGTGVVDISQAPAPSTHSCCLETYRSLALLQAAQAARCHVLVYSTLSSWPNCPEGRYLPVHLLLHCAQIALHDPNPDAFTLTSCVPSSAYFFSWWACIFSLILCMIAGCRNWQGRESCSFAGCVVGCANVF